MAPSAKGKEKVVDGSGSNAAAKRKRNNAGDAAGRKRNRSVLQFFEDAADVDEDDASDDSLFGDEADFLEDEFVSGSGSASGSKGPNENAKAPFLPFVPKEEQITEEEFDKMLEERYKPGSGFVTYTEDNYENKKCIETSTYLPSAKEPVIWKVKCMVGRERHSAFCLMQKYVDLVFLGTKLQIISAFALDHIKGFIYIEAEKQSDIYEACNGLCSIYSSRVMPVPKDEISHLFSVRSKGNGISEGMWARVKSGTYKGDLAQVVAVNNIRKKVTVKLIPRIDLQAMAEKFGRGITPHKAVTPAPRLISSSELEEFRPLIQYRRDRDTNKIFEILDGMMLKDGYLYKKVSMDSLNFWGVTPKEDELLKFEPSKNDECNDLEWLSQLYGERRKKRPVISGKGSGKGEGSSSFSMEHKFEVHDLVFFGRKDFGVIIGSEKDDSFKIIKEGSEGPVSVTLQARELKNAEFDKKLFTALDQKLKNISVNDTVRVLDGPLKDKQGVVKKIYGGIVFLYNESEEKNNGYISTKARFCEKVEPTGGACNEKSGEPGSSGFGDLSSPKSPLSPEQSQQEKGGSCKFNRDDNAMFSIGQLLRIRLGPLKGHICRVMAVRRSDVTVKLDSQHKILTVKCEHVSEVRGRSSGVSTGVDAGSVKPFDLLGEQDGSRDWMDGAATEGGSWNAGGFSTERSSWPAFPASNSLVQQESASSVAPKPVDAGTNKDDSSWEAKATPSQGSSWGAAGAALETVAGAEEVAGWGSEKKAASNTGFGDGASDNWGKAVESCHQATGTVLKDDSWSQAAGNLSCKDGSNRNESAWNGFGVSPEKQNTGWGNAGQSSSQPEGSAWNKSTILNEDQTNSWCTKKKDEGTTGGWEKKASTWDKAVVSEEKGSSEENKKDPWGKKDSYTGNATGMDGSSASLDGQGGGWNKTAEVTHGSSHWNKQDGECSWSKQNVGGGPSSWSKQDGGSTSWSKPDGGSTSWTKQDGGSSWKRGESGASWNSAAGMGNEDDTDQQGSWGRPRAFDGGRGSGGRRGRGGGRGGRDQFGRGRSFGQGQNTNWKNEDQDDHGSNKRFFGENRSSWTSGQAGGWKEPSGSGGEKCDWDSKSSSWQNSKSTQDKSSSWNKSSTTIDEAAKPLDGTGGWNKRETAAEDSKSPWGSGTSSLDKNQLSAWGTPKASLDNTTGDAGNGGGGGGGWNHKKSSEEGLSSGWGQSKLDVSGAAGGNQGSWGSKSNWGASKACLDNNNGDADSGGGGDWKNKQSSEGGSSFGWGQSKWGGATDNTASRSADNGGGGWNGKKFSEERPSSGWGQSKCRGTGDAGGNQGSWGSKSSWAAPKSCLDNTTGDADNVGGGSWNWKKSSEGGSSSGCGQSKWGGTTDKNTTGDVDNGGGGGWNSKKSSEGGSSSGCSQSKWCGTTDNTTTGDANDGGGGGGGWNSRKSFEGGSSSSWGGTIDKNTTGDADNGGGGWNSKKSSEGGSSSGWGQSKWGGTTDNTTTGDANDGGAGAWNSRKSSEGGSSSGWGQNKQGGTTDVCGNQGSWGSKSNWSSENNFGGSEEQTDTFGDNGRGGSWREGRGGRWGSDGGRFGSRGGSGRGGFRGRGGSDRGGFGGRGRSDRGGFGGRGRSDRGGFGGRGGFESGGFHGRGGFGGRGRGRRDDWNSNNEAGEVGSSGWKSEWAAGSGDRAQAGGWNKAVGWGSDGGSDAKDSGTNGGEGHWSTANSSGGPTSSAWNQPSASRVEGTAGSSWGQPSDASSKDCWGQSGGGSGKGGSWDQPSDRSSKGGW